MTTTYDVVVDLQYGDCGKGKVSHLLCTGKNKPDYVIRYNGGENAGHTIWHEGKKYVTHYIPAGAFYGIPCIIGPGCVVHAKNFFNELTILEEALGRKIDIKIASNCGIITDAHLREDEKDIKIGTCKKGTGPAYAERYARTSPKAVDIFGKNFVIDFTKFIYNPHKQKHILFEGAQGMWLDINFGDYPYVTSSHTTIAGVLATGVPYSGLRKVYGVAKAYETYVGEKDFQPQNEIFKKIAQTGGEFGSTTGRLRKVNWMNVERLVQAILHNNVTHLVINKIDILEQIDSFNFQDIKPIIPYKNIKEWKTSLKNQLKISNQIFGYYQLKKIGWGISPTEIKWESLF